MRTRVFALTWLAYASYYLGRKGFSVTKVAIARELGVGTEVLASIDTGYLVAYALGQVPSGVAADRFGARWLIGAGLIASAAACALFGIASGALVLGVCFTLNGLAQSTGWPGTNKAMAEHTTPRDRGRVMGWWSTCYQVGGVVATALATYLLARYGWRAAFFTPALCMLAVGILIWIALPSSRSAQAAQSASDAPAPATNAKAQPLELGLIFSYGACYFCLKLIRYSLLFWLPFYLHTEAGFGEEESGYLSTSFEIGGVVGSIGLGALSDRAMRAGLRRAHAAAGSIALLALSLLVYAGVGTASMPVHFALIALIGALLFGPDALLSGAAAQDAAATGRAATAVGLVNGMGSAGALLQGLLTVTVQRTWGWNALFYVFFALAVLAAVCLLPALRKPSENVNV